MSSKNKKKTMLKSRSGTAVAAQHRNSAGKMKHRLEEKEGSRNEERSLISEYVNDVLEKIINSSKEEEKPNLLNEDGEEDEFEL